MHGDLFTENILGITSVLAANPTCANESSATFHLTHNVRQQQRKWRSHDVPHQFRRGLLLKNDIQVVFLTNNRCALTWKPKTYITSNKPFKTEWRPSNKVRLKIPNSSAEFSFAEILKFRDELYFVSGEGDDKNVDRVQSAGRVQARQSVTGHGSK